MTNYRSKKFDLNNINRLEQEMQYQKAVRLTDALDVVVNDEVVVVTDKNKCISIDRPQDLLKARNEYGLRRVGSIKTNEFGKMFIYITDETVSSQLTKRENVQANAYNLPTYKQFLNTVPKPHIIYDEEVEVIDTPTKQKRALKEHGDKKILSFEIKNNELVLILDYGGSICGL